MVPPFGAPCPAGTMKTEKTAGTLGLLAKVGPNLYRHRLNGTYYGRKKIAGKRTIHGLRGERGARFVQGEKLPPSPR